MQEDEVPEDEVDGNDVVALLHQHRLVRQRPDTHRHRQLLPELRRQLLEEAILVDEPHLVLELLADDVADGAVVEVEVDDDQFGPLLGDDGRSTDVVGDERHLAERFAGNWTCRAHTCSTVCLFNTN